MSFKTKKEAIASIRCREKKVKGKIYQTYETYLGTNCITKKEERLSAPSKDKLEDMIEDFYRARSQSGDLASALTINQIVDAQTALRTLREAGMDISLSECAKREVERSARISFSDKKLGDAYSEYIIYKTEVNSPSEVRKTGSTVGNWVEKLGRDRTVSSVTIDDVANYVKTFYGEMDPTTYNAQVSYIRTFLNWCADDERRFIEENPILKMKLKPVETKRPRYMKPNAVKKLFDLLWKNRAEHPEYLALAVTQFFVGVRREEMLRIAESEDAATIIIEDASFRIDKVKGYTKGITARAAHIPNNAVAWMKSFDYLSALKMVGEKTTGSYYALARENGIPVFKNCARHTLITMHVAKYHMPEVTQHMVGTSGKMRAEHYDGLAPQREGEEYFDILPPCQSV